MEKVRLGRVVGTHGIKGEIKIYLTTQFPEERFAPGKMIYLVHQNQETGYEVESFRMHKGMALVKLAAFNNINEVEGFRDDEVYGDREELLDEEGFYYDELIGYWRCRPRIFWKSLIRARFTVFLMSMRLFWMKILRTSGSMFI